MLGYGRNQHLAVPVAHAFGLACWSMFQPRESWTPLALWAIWLPIVGLLFSPRILLLVCAGAAPFLAFHVFYRA